MEFSLENERVPSVWLEGSDCFLFQYQYTEKHHSSLGEALVVTLAVMEKPGGSDLEEQSA